MRNILCVFIVCWDLKSNEIKSLHTMNRGKKRNYWKTYCQCKPHTQQLGSEVSIKRVAQKKDNKDDEICHCICSHTDQSNESSIDIDFIIGGPLQNQNLKKKPYTHSAEPNRTYCAILLARIENRYVEIERFQYKASSHHQSADCIS